MSVMAAPAPARSRPQTANVGFVMEQTLGHVTHHRNLEQWTAEQDCIRPLWMPVAFDARDVWQRAPLARNNWTVRASLRAKALVNATAQREPLDALFFHTQVTALFAARWMRRIPTILSLDATPLNVDTMAAAYDHHPSASARVEALKNALNRRAFSRAAHLVTWCAWARDSLVQDYGIDAARISVIPPGIDLERWHFHRPARSGAVRLLFVGGDFRRKGGLVLIDAFRKHLRGRCVLDIVTKDVVDQEGLPGVRVHHGLTANSPKLVSLYQQADVFVFPTQGDCLPIAVMEAMAAGLPVVAAGVGALHEEVVEGTTGFLVPPGDGEAMAHRVLQLIEDHDLRAAMGQAGRRTAEERFDGARNYAALLDLCGRCADGGRR